MGSIRTATSAAGDVDHTMSTSTTSSTPLHDAASENNVVALNALLLGGYLLWNYDVYERDYRGWTALHLACAKGHLECVQALCEHSKDLWKSWLWQESPTNLRTPLHLAIRNGHLPVVQYLLQTGRVKASYQGIHPPFLFACRFGHVDIVQWWIEEYQTDLTLTAVREPKTNATGLHMACRAGHLALVQFPTERFAHIPHYQLRDNSGNTPLHWACNMPMENGGELTLSVVRYLIDDGHANVHLRNHDGYTPFHEACAKGNLVLVKFLLETGEQTGLDSRQRTRDDQTALDLVWAVEHPSPNVTAVRDFLQPYITKIDFFAFLPPGQHPGMDALARGLAAGVKDRGGTLRLRCHQVVDKDILQRAVQEGVEAIYLFVTEPHQPSAAVIQEIMQGGVAVYTIHRPWYAVTGSVVVPNFYQGVALANRLAQALVKRRASSKSGEPKIAILGGPAIVDDEELVLGCLDGSKRAQMHVLNDPFQAEYRNLHDVQGVSQAVVEKLFDKFANDMDGLIVFNDETLHDVIAFVERKGLLGKFPIVSRNGSPQVIEYVRKGWTTATFDYHLPEIGRLAASLLDEKPGTVKMAPLGTLYDAHNIQDYTPWEVRAPVDVALTVVSRD